LAAKLYQNPYTGRQAKASTIRKAAEAHGVSLAGVPAKKLGDTVNKLREFSAKGVDIVSRQSKSGKKITEFEVTARDKKPSEVRKLLKDALRFVKSTQPKGQKKLLTVQIIPEHLNKQERAKLAAENLRQAEAGGKKKKDKGSPEEVDMGWDAYNRDFGEVSDELNTNRDFLQSYNYPELEVPYLGVRIMG
jgi:hypothetical protein